MITYRSEISLFDCRRGFIMERQHIFNCYVGFNRVMDDDTALFESQRFSFIENPNLPLVTEFKPVHYEGWL